MKMFGLKFIQRSRDLKIYFKTVCDAILIKKKIISQDHPEQLVTLTTFLHKASFSMALACLGLEYQKGSGDFLL